MIEISKKLIFIFSLLYFFGEINFVKSHHNLQWDHQDMTPIANIPHTAGPAGSPVHFYQIGHGGRVEYMEAVVDRHHLNTGTKTTSASTTYVRNLGGDHGDDAGHVLASRLGGSGTDHHNLFPQNPSCNRGAWSSFIEAVVAKEVTDHGATAYKVKLLYHTATDLRPYEIMGQITLHNGQHNYYTNELANPPSNQKCGD